MGYKSLEVRMKPSVYGVGYLGANTDVPTKVNGRNCALYIKWTSMLKRCYSEKQQIKQPTYIGCTVSDEFKDYSKWREWYDNYQYKQEGWQLDKDLLVKGNKVYSRETCVLLPKEINLALTTSRKSRGEHLIGVSFHKQSNKFLAGMFRSGKYLYLGLYNTEIDAHLSYKEAKEAYIKEVANKWKDQIDPRAYEALINYQVEITD